MHDPVKRVEQLFFEVHAACPSCTWSPSPTAMLPPAESHDPCSVSMKIFVRIHFSAHALKISVQSETHSHFAAMYR